MSHNNSNAYTEVLMLLDYFLIEEDYNKIPKNIIENMRKNSNPNHKFIIDKQKGIEEQVALDETYQIIIWLYREYFLNESQKTTLNEILSLKDKQNRLNQNIEGSKITQKSEVIFPKTEKIVQVKEDRQDEGNLLPKIKKETVLSKIINKIRRIFVRFFK